MKIFEITIFGITIAPTYYALMYILGISAAYIFLKKNHILKTIEDLDSVILYAGIGIILGGRIGYILLYNLPYYLNNPQKILAFWEGGMSFHGGFLGVIFGIWLFCKKYGYKFWSLLDAVAVVTPIGLAFGRFGNYLNNELYGFAPYQGPFTMIVNGVGHFPSPLLELFLEGIILGSILFILYYKSNWKLQPGKLSGVFAIGYALSRIFVEFFRLPDAQLGYLFGSNFITAGMIYSFPILFVGIFLILRNTKK